jgi:tetratricopeptide (TPR) repeat protein
LLFSFAGLIVAFLVTGFAARGYHSRRSALARSWFERGTRDLQAGKPAAAVSDFQTTLIYARGDVPEAQWQLYELEFSQALAATNRPDEARSYLLDLWERAPGSGKINLELARLAARTGDDAEAKRYYNDAIYGVWEGDSTEVARRRREARLELFRYLASRNETTEAQSVLMAATAALQPDAGAPLHAQLGNVLLEAGQAQQALEQFEQALRIDPHDRAATAGAGVAAFALGDDRTAVRYLAEASRGQGESAGGGQEIQQKNDPRVAQDLAIAEATLALDPYAPHLDTPERARRAAKSFQAALSRLEECAKAQGIPLANSASAGPADSQTDDLAALYARAAKLRNSVGEDDLARHPPSIDPIIEMVFDMESKVTARCGPPVHPADAALARIAQRAGNAHS